MPNSTAHLKTKSKVIRFPIAEDGTVVGYSDDGTFLNTIAVYWDPSGAVHALPRLHDWAMRATAVNNLGLIVGTAYQPAAAGSVGHAWIFDKATGVLAELPGAIDGSGALPHAINDAGEIVGSVIVNSWHRAVRWSAGTHELTLLPLLQSESRYSEATDINASGTIVGTHGSVPVVWPVGAAPIPLPTGRCTRGLATFDTNAAVAINDAGMVAGTLMGYDGCTGPSKPVPPPPTPQFPPSHAVRWNTAHELEQLGDANSVATALNALGVTVGYDRLGAQRWP